MPLEAKDMLPKIVMLVLLLLLGIVVFTSQITDTVQGFFSSLKEDEAKETSEVQAVSVGYLSSGSSVFENLKAFMSAFDPESHIVYCKFPADYDDGDEKDNYIILCDPVVFNIPKDTDLYYSDVYTNVFSKVITDSWAPQTFKDKGYTIEAGGPTFIEISADQLNFEGNCWGSSVETTVFGSGKKKIFVEQLLPDKATVPSQKKIMVRMAFSVSEPGQTFNPAVSLCPNIIR